MSEFKNFLYGVFYVLTRTNIDTKILSKSGGRKVRFLLADMSDLLREASYCISTRSVADILYMLYGKMLWNIKAAILSCKHQLKIMFCNDFDMNLL